MLPFTEKKHSPSELELLRQQTELKKEIVDVLIDDVVCKYGTSEGVTLSWDTRGRGRKKEPTPLETELGHQIWDVPKTPEEIARIERSWSRSQEPPVPKEEPRDPAYDSFVSDMKRIAPNCEIHAFGIDPKFANTIVYQAAKLKADYPRAMANLKQIVLGNTDGGWASYSSKLKTITLDSDYFTPENTDKFYKGLHESEQNGFHPPGCNTPEYAFTHEFGHFVHDEWVHESSETLSDADRQRFHAEAGHPDLPNWTPQDDLIMGLEGQLKYNPASEYAKHDSRELFAESFASVYFTPPEKQKPGVKLMARIFNTAYWKHKWGAGQ